MSRLVRNRIPLAFPETRGLNRGGLALPGASLPPRRLPVTQFTFSRAKLIALTAILSLSFGLAGFGLQGKDGDVFAVGEVVMAKLKGAYLRATILKREDDQYFVRFEGRSEDDDQWVSSVGIEKLAGFGRDFRTSSKNTREYKLRAEIEYFCKKEAERRNLRAAAFASYVSSCQTERTADSDPAKKPAPLARFNPKKPHEFDIHQACLGEFTRFCADQCDEYKEEFCLPQCLESADKCRSAFYYDVDLNTHCNKKGAAEWLMETYNKVYDQGGRSVWLQPKVYWDTRKDPEIYKCSVPWAKKMIQRDACSSLERCNAVCQVKPDSQAGATDSASCKKKCRGWFPAGKCHSYVEYTF